MKALFVTLMMCMALSSRAEKQLVGIKGGILSANVQSDGLFEGADNRLGVNSGFTFDYFLNDRWSVGAELLYQGRGMTEYTPVTDNLGVQSQESYPIKFRYDYVCLPLKVTASTGKKLYGFASVGLTPGVLLSATMMVPVLYTHPKVYSTYVGEEKRVATEYVRKFDLGGMIEAGGGYKIRKRYWVYGAVGYQQSFTSFAGDQYFKGQRLQHHGWTATIGLKVGLKQ